MKDIWTFHDRDEGSLHRIVIVHDPDDTLIRILADGSDVPILELDDDAAENLADLLKAVSDAAGNVKTVAGVHR